MHRLPNLLRLTLLVAVVIGGTRASAGPFRTPPPGSACWYKDYAQAVQQAERCRKMLLVLFHGTDDGAAAQRLACRWMSQPELSRKLRGLVCVHLPLSAPRRVDGPPQRLVDHESFAALEGRSGVAIIDLAHPEAPHAGLVVSVLPFGQHGEPSTDEMAVLLDLPAGMPDRRAAEFAQRLEARQHARRPTAPSSAPSGVWLSDYDAASQEAQRQQKMLLIHFRGSPDDAAARRFEDESLAAEAVEQRLGRYVCVRLPLEATAGGDQRPQRLIDDASFQEMLGRPGLAVVDYTDRESPHFGAVVSTFPLTGRHWYTPSHVSTILDLPPGSLTQRTLIYAVRIHPERPASTHGQVDHYLLHEAASHSDHQARIRVQGHHNWGMRFQRILGRLPGGLVPTEVCAESWPGERLLDAAIECVRCWRQSSGHWRAVSGYHPRYAYDMKRGANGIWYATGLFGEGRLAGGDAAPGAAHRR